jgi:uncharacterized protein
MTDARLADLLANAPAARPVRSLAALDGFLTALFIGPRFVEPPEWIAELLGDHAFCADATTPEAAAIQAFVVRYNHLSQTLSVQPELYQPLLARRQDSSLDAGSWIAGFIAAIKPRAGDWRDVFDVSGVERGLLLPLYLHGAGRSGLLDASPMGKALLDQTGELIRPMVIAVREFWLPRRVADAWM